MIGCLPTQALAFLAVFVYATHAAQAIAFEWKPGLRAAIANCGYYVNVLNLWRGMLASSEGWDISGVVGVWVRVRASLIFLQLLLLY